jgi:hypothetical protein
MVRPGDNQKLIGLGRRVSGFPRLGLREIVAPPAVMSVGGR